MAEWIRRHHKTLLFLLFSSVIFLSRIWYIRDCNALAIRNDEYGYWTHAALFTGHDWSDVFAGHMNWYSYGYSLVLVPLFLLSHSLHLMYKAAILLNGLFAVLSYVLCICCARMLFPKISGFLLLAASFMSCMYSSFITQGPIAWSETFLYLLVWLLLYLFLRFEQKPCASRALLLSVCMGACYITHNRTIGIVTAYFLIVLFLLFTEAIDWKLSAALLIPLLVILFYNADIKTYLCIMEGFGLKAKNGLGAQKDHLLSLLTIEGCWNLLRSLSGQMWSLAAATFGLLYWGLLHCVRHLIHAVRAGKARKHVSFYLFTLLSCAGTFLVSAISLIDPASITNLESDTDLTYFIYTRYDECIIGILLLCGFLHLAFCRKDLRFVLETAGLACLYAAASVILYFNLQRIEDTWHYRSFCAAGIGFYRLLSEDFAMSCCIIISVAGFAIMLLLVSFSRKRFWKVRIAGACLFLTAVFIPTGLYSAKIGTINSQLGKVSSGNLSMYGLLKEVAGSHEVYCTLDDTKNYRIAYELQVNLIDTHVYSITMEDLPVTEEGYFICCSSGDLDSFCGDDYYMLTQSRYYTVIAKGDTLAEEVSAKLERSLVNLNSLE